METLAVAAALSDFCWNRHGACRRKGGTAAATAGRAAYGQGASGAACGGQRPGVCNARRLKPMTANAGVRASVAPAMLSVSPRSRCDAQHTTAMIHNSNAHETDVVTGQTRRCVVRDDGCGLTVQPDALEAP